MTELTDEAVTALLAHYDLPTDCDCDGDDCVKCSHYPTFQERASKQLIAAAPGLARALLDARAELAQARAEHAASLIRINAEAVEAVAQARADAQAAVALMVEKAAERLEANRAQLNFAAILGLLRDAPLPEAIVTALSGWLDAIAEAIRALAPASALAELQRLRVEARENAMQALASMGQAHEAYEAQLEAEAELAAAQQREAGLVERAEKAEQERDRIDQWRETAIVERDTYSEERDAAEGRVAALTEALRNLVGPDCMYDGRNIIIPAVNHGDAIRLVAEARSALAPTPTDPGDGWTWNERLGWIGPDGKPADPRRRG